MSKINRNPHIQNNIFLVFSIAKLLTSFEKSAFSNSSYSMRRRATFVSKSLFSPIVHLKYVLSFSLLKLLPYPAKKLPVVRRTSMTPHMFPTKCCPEHWPSLPPPLVGTLHLPQLLHSLGMNLAMCRDPFHSNSSFPPFNRFFSSLFSSLALHSFFISLFPSNSLPSMPSDILLFLPSFFASSQTKLDVSSCSLLIGHRLIGQSECFPLHLISGRDLLHFGILFLTALPIESRPHLRQNCVVTVFVVHLPHPTLLVPTFLSKFYVDFQNSVGHNFFIATTSLLRLLLPSIRPEMDNTEVANPAYPANYSYSLCPHLEGQPPPNDGEFEGKAGSEESPKWC